MKEHELGAKIADLCRKYGISEETFYNCRSKFGGMDVSEAKRLKTLQTENAKRTMLENAATPAVKREAVAHLTSAHEMS